MGLISDIYERFSKKPKKVHKVQRLIDSHSKLEMTRVYYTFYGETKKIRTTIIKGGWNKVQAQNILLGRDPALTHISGRKNND